MRQMIAAGASTMTKSANERPAAEPIMMLGGSPMRVAVPPMLEAMISARKNGRGSRSSRRQTVTVMGPMSRTVVTLSSRAESTAVRQTKSTITSQGLPFARRAHLMARYSKSPDSFTTATKSIMPRRTPSVLKSTCSIAASKLTTWRMSRIIAPTTAASARWIFSVTIATMTTTNTTMAIIWVVPMRFLYCSIFRIRISIHEEGGLVINI